MNSSSRCYRSTSILRKSCLSVLVAFALMNQVSAQQPAQATQYAVPAGDLVKSVNEISRSSGVQIVYDIELLRGLKAGEVKGSLTLEQALDRALRGSGLGWVRVSPTTVSIQKLPATSKPPLREKRNASPTPSDQQATQGKGVYTLDDVVVVGSRLGTSPGESAMPIKLITREDIDRSSAGNIAQMLSYMSEVSVNNSGDVDIGGNGSVTGGSLNSTTVQMRGLPRGTTLILINGRRAGESSAFTFSGQFDLSTIPLALVERIEILPAGASAIYGGDGLAGVVNIVLRRDANGVEIRGRRTSSDSHSENQASILWGKSWSAGQLTATINWRETGRLSSFDRSLTSDQDFRRFGGMDFRTGAGNPATIYSLEGCPADSPYCFLPIEERGNLPGLNSPYAIVPKGQDGRKLTIQDFIPTAGSINSESHDYNILSAEKSYSAALNGSIELSDDLEVFTEWSYSSRDIPSYQLPLASFLGLYGIEPSVVPASHPFNPFGVAVGFDYLFNDTGIYRSSSQRYWRGLLGTRGKLNRMEWEASAWTSRDRSMTGGAQAFESEAFTAALASVDPDAVLNPFVGDGRAPASPEVLRSMTTPYSGDYGSNLIGLNGFIRGPLVDLPAGKVVGLAGVEYQTQSLHSRAIDASLAVEGDTASRAAFAEIRVPLWAARPNEQAERLALTSAVRRESSDRFHESASTGLIGIEFRPSSKFLVRATRSTAFKPLLAISALTAPLLITSGGFDPNLGGQYVRFNALVYGGVPSGLLPETSVSRTFGAVYSHDKGWRLSATYWDIKLRNRISGVGAQLLIDNEKELDGRVIRDLATGVITKVDMRPINISLSDLAGVDLGFDGSWSNHLGEFIPSLSATYMYKYQEQLTPDSPLQDNLGVLRSSGWAPRWKIVPQISWDSGKLLYATVVGRYVSRYKDPTPLSTGPNAGTMQSLGDLWQFDMNIDFAIGRQFMTDSKFFSGTKLNFGALNILNRLPDFCASCGYAGYDSSQYDIRGRTIHAELRVSF